jgi:hypothetical protein
MGWWGYDVMEGDGPMDIDHGLVDIVKHETASAVLAAVDAHPMCRGWAAAASIALQVWGYRIMEAGKPLSEHDKRLVRVACEEDAWARTDSMRKAAMGRFIETLAAYDDTPWEGTSKGLFDTLEAKLADADADGPGLINVGPEATSIRNVGDES